LEHLPIADSGHLQKTAECGDISRQGFGSDLLLQIIPDVGFQALPRQPAAIVRGIRPSFKAISSEKSGIRKPIDI
jgi:hypothetical protein